MTLRLPRGTSMSGHRSWRATRFPSTLSQNRPRLQELTKNVLMEEHLNWRVEIGAETKLIYEEESTKESPWTVKGSLASKGEPDKMLDVKRRVLSTISVLSDGNYL
jgi:hypothetical protein